MRVACFSLLCLLGSAVSGAQTSVPPAATPAPGHAASGQANAAQAGSGQPATAAADGKIHLDIYVQTKAGQAAPALAASDVTVLDNGHPQTLSSFKAVAQGQEPAELIFVMDAANVRHTNLAYQQTELQNFLRAAGQLPHPATIAVLTDKGVEILPGFSKDGTELSKTLDNYNASLRTITRSAGFWGATERLELSQKAMDELTAYAKRLPGRKFVFWISPGWPLLSGPGIELGGKQQQWIFSRVVALSNELRLARVTIFDVNPFGVQESLLNASYYKTFVKGVRKASETDLGDLGLQVLAEQSGGRTLTTNNDIAGGLKECVGETLSWYEAEFPMPPAEGPNEYHHVEVHVAVNGASLPARTRQGYYAQPSR